MNAGVKEILKFSFVALSSIFFIVDPLAAIPSFLVMTADDSEDKRRRAARQAAWTCLLDVLSSMPAGPSVARLVSTPVCAASLRSPVRNAG